MKSSKVKNILLLLFLLQVGLSGSAQEFGLGPSFGFNSLGGNDIREVGVRFEMFKPAKNYGEMSFWLEESYHRNLHPLGFYNVDGMFVDYFKTEAGFDLNIGKRSFFVLGGGLALSFLSRKSNHFDLYAYEVKLFNIVARLNIGYGLNVTNNIGFKSVLVFDKGITPYYYKPAPCHFGNKCGEEPISESNIYIKLFLYYKLNKKVEDETNSL